MEVDDFQKQVSKFQKVSSNGSSTTTTDNSQKIATHSRGILESPNDGGGGGGGGGESKKYDVGLGVGLCGWPTSRIVRVSRASGGKDRHSKVLTSKGLRDRRVRLSVSTAIQFYDLQDRLGYDQPSKAVEWLLKAASSSIDELPSLDPPFSVADYCQQQQHLQQHKHIDVKSNADFEDLGYTQQQLQNRLAVQNNNNNNVVTKSPACSSTSETSKGSGLSLSNRSENRIKARERAREMASKKEKDKDDQLPKSTCAPGLNPNIENSSFTDLLTGGINNNTTTTNTASRPSSETRTHWTTAPSMDYFFTRNPNTSTQLIQIPQFNNQQHLQHHQHQQHQQHQQQHFAFLQDGFVPAAVATAGESYNLNFSMTPLSSNGNVSGFSRGTLQSNLPSTLLPHHSHHLQRFQSSSVDGSTSGNMPFFIVPNPGSDHFPTSYHLSYGNGGANSDQHKEKSKN